MVSPDPQTVRERVYEIRRALGPDRRTPLTGGEFAKRANAVAARFGLKARFDASVISKIETGVRTVSIEEVPIFAALDPLERGESWLAWGRLPGQPQVPAVPIVKETRREKEIVPIAARAAAAGSRARKPRGT